jgi:hypothetical protein
MWIGLPPRVGERPHRLGDDCRHVGHRAGIVVERGRRVRARQVDGDRAVIERLERGDHSRPLGGAAERAVD